MQSIFSSQFDGDNYITGVKQVNLVWRQIISIPTSSLWMNFYILTITNEEIVQNLEVITDN